MLLGPFWSQKYDPGYERARWLNKKIIHIGTIVKMMIKQLKIHILILYYMSFNLRDNFEFSKMPLFTMFLITSRLSIKLCFLINNIYCFFYMSKSRLYTIDNKISFWELQIQIVLFIDILQVDNIIWTMESMKRRVREV